MRTEYLGAAPASVGMSCQTKGYCFSRKLRGGKKLAIILFDVRTRRGKTWPKTIPYCISKSVKLGFLRQRRKEGVMLLLVLAKAKLFSLYNRFR
jgi:hypothetical protein